MNLSRWTPNLEKKVLVEVVKTCKVNKDESAWNI